MKYQLLIALCLLSVYGECRWYHKEADTKTDNREIVNQDNPGYTMISVSPNPRKSRNSTLHSSSRDPPDHTKLIEMARYVMHNSNWASLATISVLPAIEGFPFSNVKSIVDGSLQNSTGVPYFYMSPLDFSARDLKQNKRATVLVSLEETNYCEKQKFDPEDPRCTRLMLTGVMKKIPVETPEFKFAIAALFERHPAMADFPTDHNWFVAKLRIAQIAMIDWFGGAKYIPVQQYLAYNYTGQELYDYVIRTYGNTVNFHKILLI